MSTVQLIVPSGPAFGSFFENRALSTGVACWSRSLKTPSCSQRQCTMCAKAETTPLCHCRSPVGGIGIAKPCSSRALASASSFILSQARSSLRMSIDSAFAIAPRPRGCSAPLTQTSNGTAGLPDLADENRERLTAFRDLDHVGPREVAFGQIRAARPLETRDGRLRRRGQAHAAVRIVFQVLRRGIVRGRLLLHDLEHRTDHIVRPVGRDALEPGVPCGEVQVLEVLERIVFGDVDGLADRRIDVRLHRCDHLHVIAGAHLECADESVRQTGSRHRPCAGTGDRHSPRRCTPACCRRASASCGYRSTRTSARCRRTHCRRTRARSCRSARSIADANCECPCARILRLQRLGQPRRAVRLCQELVRIEEREVALLVRDTPLDAPYAASRIVRATSAASARPSSLS